MEQALDRVKALGPSAAPVDRAAAWADLARLAADAGASVLTFAQQGVGTQATCFMPLCNAKHGCMHDKRMLSSLFLQTAWSKTLRSLRN